MCVNIACMSQWVYRGKRLALSLHLLWGRVSLLCVHVVFQACWLWICRASLFSSHLSLGALRLQRLDLLPAALARVVGVQSPHTCAVSTLHTGPSPQLLGTKDVHRQLVLPIGLWFLSLKQKHPDYTKENDCLFSSIPKAPQSTLLALYLMFKTLLCSYAQVDVSESCLTYVCVCGVWHIVGA